MRSTSFRSGLVAAALALAGAALLLEIWRADMHVPFAYDHDAIFNLVAVKNLLQQGWPLTNPDLGAPFGSQLYDFPVVAGDSLHLVLMHVLGLFSSDPAFVANAFFLVTFPLTAAIACYVLERLGLSTWTAIACAVLFALAPYHFFRGEVHLFLQAYYGVPLGIYLAVLVASGEPLRARHGLAALGLMCVVAATTDVYFAAFTLILLAIACAIAAIDPPRRAALRGGLAAIGVIAAVVAIQHLPSAVYHARHGDDRAVAALRSPSQSETFGMKLVRMVLPVDDHRVGPLARTTERYVEKAPDQRNESSSQSLGLAATIGFLFLLGFALVRVVVQSRPRTDDTPAETHMPATSLLALSATLIALAGGFSLVISYLFTDAIRSWNRMSIVIAFMSLFAFGVLLERLRPHLRAAWAWPALLAVVVVVATLDQVPAEIVPPYKELARVWHGERDYFRDLDNRLPDNALIYNAPYFPFPERGYDEARGYLHSDDLRWTFGAVEGRPQDWPAGLAGQPGTVIVPSVAAAGASGVLVNTALYRDGGAAADADLRRLTGAGPITSANGLYRFYDLRKFRRHVEQTLGPDAAVLRDRTLHPVRIQYGSEFSSPTFESGDPLSIASLRYTDRPSGTVEFTNPSPHPRRVTFKAELVDEHGGGSRAAVAWPDGKLERFNVTAAGLKLDHTFDVPPGTTKLQIATDQARVENADRYFSLRNTSVTDEQAAALALKAGNPLQ